MSDKIRCFRCRGRKKIFKVGSGYTLENTGGLVVACPLCIGEGFIKTLETAIEDSKKDVGNVEETLAAPERKSRKASHRKTNEIQS